MKYGFLQKIYECVSLAVLWVSQFRTVCTVCKYIGDYLFSMT